MVADFFAIFAVIFAPLCNPDTVILADFFAILAVMLAPLCSPETVILADFLAKPTDALAPFAKTFPKLFAKLLFGLATSFGGFDIFPKQCFQHTKHDP
jgi:hypothetical protein